MGRQQKTNIGGRIYKVDLVFYHRILKRFVPIRRIIRGASLGTYRWIARKEYLDTAKAKRRSAKKMQTHIRRELGRVGRDLEYLSQYMEAGYGLPEKYIDRYLVIQELYRQQKSMFDNKTHSVKNRIVSIRQPYIRPIVRGKSKSPVEFGAKYDISIGEKGQARLEKYSFDR